MSIEQPSFEQPEESIRNRVSDKLKKIIPNLFSLSTLHQDQTNASEKSSSTETPSETVNTDVEESEKAEVAQ